MQYKSVIFKTENKIAIIQINRPEALNAINTQVMLEISDALEKCDSDENILSIILTGNEKAFAAGVDIKEMAEFSEEEISSKNELAILDKINKINKPIIAAVSGFALGGGCELALACDIIYASQSAKFGQPEINIGVIPGAGGTQRLTRAIGKSKSMELILTGDFISATDAKELGLISKVFPNEDLMNETIKLAEKISSKPPLAVKLAKKSILNSFENFLNDGLTNERKYFYSLFSSEDQKEGMHAFIQKRKAVWKGK